LEPNDRLTKEKYDREIAKTLYISATGKGQTYMVYPVYPTMLSRPDEVQYYVCYLPPEETRNTVHMPEAEGNTIHMPGEDIDYSTMNRKELIALCKERGIVGMSAKKKEELIKILRGE
jgi:hypothetical protein